MPLLKTENVFGWVKNEMKWRRDFLEQSSVAEICREVRDIFSRAVAGGKAYLWGRKCGYAVLGDMHLRLD